MNEKYVFEVLEVRQKDSGWEIGGLAFDTIKKNDILSTAEPPDENGGAIQIVDIVISGRHIEEIDRGYTCWLTVTSDDDIDLAHIKYLYLA